MATARTIHTLADDAELVSSASSGNREAFDELYRRHSDAAWRLAQAVTRNAHDAAEATSEAFAKVFAMMKRGGYSADAPFRPYLLTATRNAAIDGIRDRNHETTVAPPEIDLRSAPAAEIGVIADADAALVREAFAGLPERQRTVLWLTEVEGMKPREAAAVLDLSPNAVSQLAVRARSGLRERYVQAHLSQAETRACKRVVTRLSGYLAGDLPPRDISIIDQHLAACEACRQRAEEAGEVRSRLAGLALPIPLALSLTSADKWAQVVTGAVAGAGKSLILPGVSGLTPYAQRALVGAAALFVGAGVMGVTLFGSSDPFARSELARPAEDAVVDEPEPPAEVDLDLASPILEPMANAANDLNEGAASGAGSMVGEVARGTTDSFEETPSSSDGGDDDGSSLPTLPEGPSSTNPPPSEPPPPTGIETPLPVQIETSANLLIETVNLNAGECTGVDTCDSTTPTEPGIDVTVDTPITDEITISTP